MLGFTGVGGEGAPLCPGKGSIGPCSVSLRWLGQFWGGLAPAQPTLLPNPSRQSVGFAIHNRSCFLCRAASKFVYSDENRIYKSPKAQRWIFLYYLVIKLG